MASESRSKKIIVTLLGFLTAPLAGFLTAPILAQGLGVTERGEVTAATAPLALGMSIFTMGLPEATTFFVARNPEKMRSILMKSSTLILLAAIIGTALFVALGPFFAGYDDDLTRIMLICTLMLLPSLWLGILRGSALGLEGFKWAAIERTFTSVFKLVIIVGLYLSGLLTVTTAALAIAVSCFIGILVYLPLIFKKQYSVQEANTINRTEILRYGMRQWFGSLAGILLARLDQLLMVPLSSAYELGIYVVAVALADLGLIVNKALREVIFALESQDTRGDRVAQAARISNLATLVSGIGIVAVSYWLIPVLFGQEFSEAWLVTVILVVASILGNPGSLAGTGLSAAGRPELRSWSLVAGCLVNLALMLWLVPEHGAIGAAFATMGGSITAANGNLIFTQKVLNTKYSDYLFIKSEDIKVITKNLRKK